MSKTNYRNKAKKRVEHHNYAVKKHNAVFTKLVEQYQQLIVENVEDDTPEEAPIRDFIFKKCNDIWLHYCKSPKTIAPIPDSFYFFNHIKDLV